MKKAGKVIGEQAAATLLNQVYGALEEVVASPKIAGYAIGVTGNPETRLRSYKGVCEVNGYVLLAWRLDAPLARFIEKGLYERIAAAPRGSKVFRKCHERIRSGAYRHSINRKFEEHFIYLCW